MSARAVKRALYNDLPLELQEIILSFCTPSTLASLSRTAKAHHKQAMVILYDTISLHDSRWEELSRCMRTLVTFRSIARLVRALVVTATGKEWSGLPLEDHKKYFAAWTEYLDIALGNMPSLRVLSVWAPAGYDVTKVELAVQRKVFKLTRLYISGLEDFPGLMASQPSLQAIGLWNMSAYWLHVYPADVPLYTQLAQYRQVPSTTNSEPQAPPPVFFGILHHNDPLSRDLTLFNYPSEQGPVDIRTGVPDVQVAARDFWRIDTRNAVIPDLVHQDLMLGWQDADVEAPEDNLTLLLPDFSCRSIVKAARLLELYVSTKFSDELLIDLRLCIIEPFEFPLNTVTLLPAIKELFSAIADYPVCSVSIDFDALNPGAGRDASPLLQAQYLKVAETMLDVAATCGAIEVKEFSLANSVFQWSWQRDERSGELKPSLCLISH